jgi:hypothetical protein
MAVNSEKRVAALEEQVARLQKSQGSGAGNRAWLDDLYGKFENDPSFAQAMKLGRQYRKSLQPRGRKGKAKRADYPQPL